MFSYRIDEETELRLLEEQHAGEFYVLQMANREHFRRWLDWPLDENYSLEDSKGFIKRALNRFASDNGFEAGIWHKGQLAGEVSIDRIDWYNRLAEVGYSLGASFEGRGIATRATQALIDHCFNGLDLHRVELRCVDENRRSRAVAERLGFKQEGILLESWWLNGAFVNQVVYRMLAAEWKNPDDDRRARRGRK